MLFAFIILVHSWYSQACCGEKDCKPIPCDQLVEDHHGWVYLPTMNYFAAEQVKPSQDRFCHVCINNKRSICAYIQQGV